MSGWPRSGFAEAWVAAAAGDAVLARRGLAAAPGFSFESAGAAVRFGNGEARFRLQAPADVWAKALQPLPPRHHHNLFALQMRVPEFSIAGDQLAFAQYCHLARRVLEIGRWIAAGHGGPVPAILRNGSAEPQPASITGRYLEVAEPRINFQVAKHRIYAEQAGNGADLLCLHTAGSDSRQFHRLMADRRITKNWRMTAFDLPWHGKSSPPPPPPGAVLGEWRLDTERYVAIIMGLIAAAGLQHPVVLGASMAGEICLELALRHPGSFRGIIACEASDNIQGRKVPWADHPQVNQAIFVPEWIEGLMAPHSPAPCAADVLWQYSQGGHATFARDIDFYAGEWDARGRVHQIDTERCPLVMLTGEYDYSCTFEHSAATAAKIPGARCTMMRGIGHFPFAENPPLFAEHLLPVLETWHERDAIRQWRRDTSVTRPGNGHLTAWRH